MSTPSDVPQPEQPGTDPAASSVPPAGYQTPPGYQAPSDQAPNYQAPDQANYGFPMSGAHNQQPTGLCYAAPARNTFGLDFSNIGQRLSNTQGVPQPLVISYWLWVAAAVLGIVLSVINMFTITNALGGLMVGAGLTGLIISVIFAALYVFIAIRLKEGARWARLVLSILGGLALISFLLQLGVGNVNFVGSAVAAAAAILMWLPQSQPHFKD